MANSQVQKIPYDGFQCIQFQLGKKYTIFLGKHVEMVNISHEARVDCHRVRVEGSGWGGVCGAGDFWSESTVLSFDFGGGYFRI